MRIKSIVLVVLWIIYVCVALVTAGFITLTLGYTFTGEDMSIFGNSIYPYYGDDMPFEYGDAIFATNDISSLSPGDVVLCKDEISSVPAPRFFVIIYEGEYITMNASGELYEPLAADSVLAEGMYRISALGGILIFLRTVPGLVTLGAFTLFMVFAGYLLTLYKKLQQEQRILSEEQAVALEDELTAHEPPTLRAFPEYEEPEASEQTEFENDQTEEATEEAAHENKTLEETNSDYEEPKTSEHKPAGAPLRAPLMPRTPPEHTQETSPENKCESRHIHCAKPDTAQKVLIGVFQRKQLQCEVTLLDDQLCLTYDESIAEEIDSLVEKLKSKDII